MGKTWTYEEDEILKSNYYELGPTDIQKLLPGRTMTSIAQRAMKFDLKCIKSKEKWSDEDIKILGEYYPYEGTLVINRLNVKRSKETIKSKAKKLGIKFIKEQTPWEVKEEELACDFYFKYKSESFKKVEELLMIFAKEGFDKHNKASLHMKLANYSYLDTGYGLSHPSKQSKKIYYNKLSLLIEKKYI